jgi:hypothetical protein
LYRGWRAAVVVRALVHWAEPTSSSYYYYYINYSLLVAVGWLSDHYCAHAAGRTSLIVGCLAGCLLMIALNNKKQINVDARPTQPRGSQ